MHHPPGPGEHLPLHICLPYQIRTQSLGKYAALKLHFDLSEVTDSRPLLRVPVFLVIATSVYHTSLSHTLSSAPSSPSASPSLLSERTATGLEERV